ncbi:MAG: uroporphyrinogen-III synthase [Caulobacteraceae bacterium]
MRRVWITRASPGAQATAERVRALGWDPLVAPLLETKLLPTRIDLTGVAALAFTSGAGARAFAQLSERRDLPVFAVGAATAEASRELGFGDVRSADADVAGLARFIADRATSLDGAILHAGAAEPAGDLVGDLAARGILARAQAVYETVDAEPPAYVFERLAEIEAVLVHSPRAGRRLAETLRDHAAPGLSAYCLSPAVLATLDGLELARKRAAPLPNEDALLSLLRDHPPRKAT